MYVHTRERDSRPGFDGVKIKLLLYATMYIHFVYADNIKEINIVIIIIIVLYIVYYVYQKLVYL